MSTCISCVLLYLVQAVTDEDLVAGFSLLADKLHKPSPSNDAVDNFKIPEKCPRQSIRELPVATVAMPMPFDAQSQLTVSASAANQAGLFSQLLAADGQTLVEARSTSAMLDPAAWMQNTAFTPVTFAETNFRPAKKKVVLLVAKKPLTSIDQSPPVDNINGSTAAVTSSHFPSTLLASSAAETKSVVAGLSTLSSQELVTGSSTGSSDQFGSSGHFELLDDHSGSSEGHAGTPESVLGASCDHLVSSGHLASSESHPEYDFRSLGEGQSVSSEGHNRSPLHDSNLSSVERKSSVVLRHAGTEVEGQEMVDEDKVETSTPVNVDHHSMVTQLKQFLGVSDI